MPWRALSPPSMQRRRRSRSRRMMDRKGYLKMSRGRPVVDFDKGVRRESTRLPRSKTAESECLSSTTATVERGRSCIAEFGGWPLRKEHGALVKFDRSRHSVTLKKASGEEETFRMRGYGGRNFDRAATGEKLDATEGSRSRDLGYRQRRENGSIYCAGLSLERCGTAICAYRGKPAGYAPTG